MKRKSDSLFHKISEENKTNTFATDSKTFLESFERHLKSNSLLNAKIQEIKALQAENTLPASKKVEQMLNVPFEYTYDFAIDFNASIPYKVNLTKNLTLVEHLKQEVKFNGIEKNFENFNNYKNRINTLNNDLKKLKGFNRLEENTNFGCSPPVILTLVVCAILWYWLGFEWIIGKLAFGLGIIILGWYAYLVYKNTEENSIIKSKTKELAEYERKFKFELNQIKSIKN